MSVRRTPVRAGVLLECDALGSTMNRARQCVEEGDTEVVAVRADYQSAGRGRRGSAWSAPSGSSLLITYILRGTDCRPDVAGSLAFVAGVAAGEAVERVAGVSPGLKWPNDLYLDARKLAGILVERAAAPDGAPAALVGIGLNVNVPAFPPELAPHATSLLLATGRMYDMAALEQALREGLADTRVLAARDGLPALLALWRRRDTTAGRRYTTLLDGHQVTGTALSITDTGALKLRLDDGRVVETMGASESRESRV